MSQTKQPVLGVVHAIHVGVPTTRGDAGASDPFDQAWTSSIFKQRVSGAVRVGRLGLEGDGQADEMNHGGLDKAVCAYPLRHYAAWNARPELSAMAAGGVGENLTIDGLSEADVCIGDTWTIGPLVVQVSQPRQPCWKLARRWRIKTFADEVIAAGRTGWYFRVLQPASIEAGDIVRLTERPHAAWTIARANAVMHTRPFDRAACAALADVPLLSESWKRSLTARATGAKV